jgi:hypothetical protein
MASEDLYRTNLLHLEIKKEAHSLDRRNENLWDFIERLAQELLILRAQVEGGSRVTRSKSFPTKLGKNYSTPE